MLFNSFPFLCLFLPIAVGFSLRLRGQALLRWICLASFTFYAFTGHFWFLGPMLFTTVLDFYIAQQMPAATGTKKRILLWTSLCGNLGLLFYFKYSGFFLATLTTHTNWLSYNYSVSQFGRNLLNVVLPAGISFYTFQTLSYIIDVYRGEVQPEKNFWLFCGFVSFFPHLVAGPLTRHHQLIPQLESIASKGITPRWRAGLFLFAIGLAKKVLIADRLANWFDPYLLSSNSMTSLTAWLSMLGFSLQIYFDFSGYSDMAIGIGRLFGVELPQNFNSPYTATDPSDFWRRWHITLSQWLRDYLYIPLGGNRRGFWRTDVNLMMTMLLGGLWHGANWTFVVWGGYHGLLLVLYRHFREYVDPLPHIVRRASTFLLVSFGWVLFRSRSIDQARAWYGKLFMSMPWADAWAFFRAEFLPLLLLTGGLGIAFLPICASKYDQFDNMRMPWQVALGLITACTILFMNYSSRFLYYQF